MILWHLFAASAAATTTKTVDVADDTMQIVDVVEDDVQIAEDGTDEVGCGGCSCNF